MKYASSYPMQSKWLHYSGFNPDAPLRLICLPYAGGTAATYKSWSTLLSKQLEVVAVQLPGRACRMGEPACSDMTSLVEQLHSELQPHLTKPYILFGHSMGSKICFALMRRLSLSGARLPEHFIASASSAPHLSVKREPIYNRTDSGFIEALRELNSTPESLLQDRDVMSIFLPMLRSDFRIAETYQVRAGYKFNLAISLFAGEQDDSITLDDVLAWREHFCRGGELTSFSGGHMFVETHKEEVIAQINAIVSQLQLGEGNFNSELQKGTQLC